MPAPPEGSFPAIDNAVFIVGLWRLCVIFSFNSAVADEIFSAAKMADTTAAPQMPQPCRSAALEDSMPPMATTGMETELLICFS